MWARLHAAPAAARREACLSGRPFRQLPDRRRLQATVRLRVRRRWLSPARQKALAPQRAALRAAAFPRQACRGCVSGRRGARSIEYRPGRARIGRRPRGSRPSAPSVPLPLRCATVPPDRLCPPGALRGCRPTNRHSPASWAFGPHAGAVPHQAHCPPPQQNAAPPRPEYRRPRSFSVLPANPRGDRVPLLAGQRAAAYPVIPAAIRRLPRLAKDAVRFRHSCKTGRRGPRPRPVLQCRGRSRAISILRRVVCDRLRSTQRERRLPPRPG